MILLRRLIKDRNATGFGTLCILVPFLFSIVLTVVFMPMGVTNSSSSLPFSGSNLNNPILYNDTYMNWSYAERKDWLLYSGDFADGFKEMKAEPIFDFFNIIHRFVPWTIWVRAVYLFNDSTVLTLDEVDQYCNGVIPTQEIDYMDLVAGIVALDPPALKYLEEYGYIIRIILVVTVAIGLVEILWIG